MRVITVARKPLSGTVAQTALLHGTGGLNIDATRIGVFQNTTPSGANRFNQRLQEQGYRPGAYPVEEKVPEGGSGRWPSNLVLVHKESCCCTGTREVRSDGHFPKARSSGSQVCGPSGHAGQEGLEERKTDGEAVEAWECAAGCPVKELDEGVGVLKSGAVKQGCMRHNSTQPSRGGFEGGFGDSPLTGFGDSGGASRFFKQVRGESSGH